ncbi:MAG: hypothetical protein JWN86_1370 [Planctomycetota bacterium]|nr:hypothetical protein [Planctomycetota bacterium]
MDVHNRNSAILGDDRIASELRSLRNAGRRANRLAKHRFHIHRGAYRAKGKRIVVFGNDGFVIDERSRREVADVMDAARRSGLTPEEFGLCDEGYTWTLVLNGVDGGPINRMLPRLALGLSASWLRASGLKVPIEMSSHHWGGPQTITEVERAAMVPTDADTPVMQTSPN